MRSQAVSLTKAIPRPLAVRKVLLQAAHKNCASICLCILWLRVALESRTLTLPNIRIDNENISYKNYITDHLTTTRRHHRRC